MSVLQLLFLALALVGTSIAGDSLHGLNTCGDVKKFYKTHACCGNPSKTIKSTGTLTQALATQFYVEQVVEEIKGFLATFSEDPKKEEKIGSMLFDVQDAQRYSHNGVLEKYHDEKQREISALCGVFDWCNAIGLPQCDMDYKQKAAMHRVLNIVQSEGGYQTMRGIMNSHRIIGEFEEWSNTVNNRTFLGEVWQAMIDQGKSVDEVSSQNFWDVVDSLGLDTSHLQYLPLAGRYVVGDGGGPPPLDTADRFSAEYHGIEWGIWTYAPGFAVRLGQFCLFNIALFLEDNSTGTVNYGDTFGIRLEGHHYSMSILYQYTDNGYMVSHTPLLVGMLPVQSPRGDLPHAMNASEPCARQPYEHQAKWVEGQIIMHQVITYFQMVIETLPKDILEQIHIPSDTFLSQHPFEGFAIPNEYQFLVLSQGVITDEIVRASLKPFQHAFLPMSRLSTKTKWATLRAFQYYTNMMAPEVAAGYMSRIAEGLANPKEKALISYSGDAPFVKEGHFFILMEINHILIELTRSPEWSLSVRPVNGSGEPMSNHIHSMMRDMLNQWSRDPLTEHFAHHHP